MPAFEVLEKRSSRKRKQKILRREEIDVFEKLRVPICWKTVNKKSKTLDEVREINQVHIMHCLVDHDKKVHVSLIGR